MSFRNAVAKLWSRPHPKTKSTRPCRRSRAFLRLAFLRASFEKLEERVLLTGYTYTKIYDGGSDVLGMPAIEGDAVAFVNEDAGEIFAHTPAGLRRIVSSETPLPQDATLRFRVLQPDLALSAGAVVFTAGDGFFNRDPSTGVYRQRIELSDAQSPELLVKAAREIPLPDEGEIFDAISTGNEVLQSSGFLRFLSPSADGDDVVFVGHGFMNTWNFIRQTSETYGIDGLYKIVDGQLLSVANNRSTPLPQEPLNGFWHFFNPSLSDGSIAFYAWDYADDSAVYSDSGGSLHPVYFDPDNVAGDRPSALDAGRITIGVPRGEDAGIWLHDGGLRHVVDTSTSIPPANTDTFTNFGWEWFGSDIPTSIDEDAIAFIGDGPSQQTGVYLYEDGTITKVIDEATLLDGKEIYFIEMGNEALSGHSLAFNVTFLDGTNAVYRADPADPVLTVITHGFQLGGDLPGIGGIPDWPVDMALAINARTGSQYKEDEIRHSQIKWDTTDLVPPSDGADGFLVYDWAELSDDAGTADSVAFKLAALIRERYPAVGKLNLHFIGHSRGAFVNARVIEFLNNDADNAKIEELQMTTLDPQNYGDDGWGTINGMLPVPSNVDWADNYFQTDDSIEPFQLLFQNLDDPDGILGGGRLVGPAGKVLNLDLTDSLVHWPGELQEHGEVHDWYHWTIDVGNVGMLPYREDDLEYQREVGLPRDLLYNDAFDGDSGDALPGNPASGLNLGFAWSLAGGGIRPTQLPLDFDGDGVTDDEEVSGLGNGDGNDDGIPDSRQKNVTTIKTLGGVYVTLDAPDDSVLVDVKAVDLSSLSTPPPGILFPLGLFGFTVSNVPPGDRGVVEVIFPDGIQVNSYYKHGPTPDDANPHWYNFEFDGLTGFLPASSNRYSLFFVDGQRGDKDLLANGVIVDPGGPGFNPPPTATLSGPASGIRRQVNTFTLGATDPSPLDQAAGFSYSIDWGDGTASSVPRAPGNGVSFSLNHAFALTGTYMVRVTATDQEGGLSAITEHPITAQPIPRDVNDDLFISAVDSLLVINHLNRFGPGPFTPPSPFAPPYLDVNRDNLVSAIDVLQVINVINGDAADVGEEGEGELIGSGRLSAKDSRQSSLASEDQVPSDLLAILAQDAVDQDLRRRRKLSIRE